MWISNLLFLSSALSLTRSQRLVNSNQIGRRCGGQMTGTSGSFASPNFGEGQNYPSNVNCTWTITVPQGFLIEFKFVFMDVEEQPPECPFDGLILHDVKTGFTANPKNDQEITKYLGRTRYCGGSKFPNVVSKSRKVEAIFYADESSQERGFNVTWKAVPVQGDEHDCNFDKGWCGGWENLEAPQDDFDWTLNSGQTTTPLTGPSFDHTTMTKNGYYAYIETSFPRLPNETAALVTPSVRFAAEETEMCLTFWYYMYGQHTGVLAVATAVGNTSTIVWLKAGQQGAQWNQGQVRIPRQDTPFKIMFVGIRGNGHQGDIAIDDVILQRTSCASASAGDGATSASSTTTATLLTDTSQSTNGTDAATNCTEWDYKCASGFSCIPRYYLCDNYQDCPDNDDEANCNGTSNNLPPLVTTPATGDYDIGDYDNYDDADANTAAASTTSSNTHSGSVTNDARRTSDVRAADAESQSTVPLSPTKKTVLPAANKTQAFPEYTKQTTTSTSGCPENYTACPNGTCIPLVWFCDLVADCLGGEDEQGCPTAEPLLETTTQDYFSEYESNDETDFFTDPLASPSIEDATTPTTAATAATVATTKATTTTQATVTSRKTATTTSAATTTPAATTTTAPTTTTAAATTATTTAAAKTAPPPTTSSTSQTAGLSTTDRKITTNYIKRTPSGDREAPYTSNPTSVAVKSTTSTASQEKELATSNKSDVKTTSSRRPETTEKNTTSTVSTSTTLKITSSGNPSTTVVSSKAIASTALSEKMSASPNRAVSTIAYLLGTTEDAGGLSKSTSGRILSTTTANPPASSTITDGRALTSRGSSAASSTPQDVAKSTSPSEKPSTDQVSSKNPTRFTPRLSLPTSTEARSTQQNVTVAITTTNGAGRVTRHVSSLSLVFVVLAALSSTRTSTS